ncbi:MAG TPA: ABC transporter ATP-binding protein [Acidimicrobiales bacterium]|nr:ABC transporter ATP-binding protein [Acidimicrobiales bacterium]
MKTPLLSRGPSQPPPDPESGSPFLPGAEPSRYEAPRATIDPDPTKSWLQRAKPIVFAHKRIFLTSLILAFVGLVIQVEIPYVLNNAINNAIVGHKVLGVVHKSALGPYVMVLVILALVGGVTGYISRKYMFKTAYAIEFDLRNIIYEHLTKMSFPFYDRVQSGQLISRANSDIRSVQMYLTFAPMILVQCSIAVVAFGFMLSLSVPLAFVAMIPMPFVFVTGWRMRQSMFPVSWLIQARLANVATIVDENINGVRVVRSFAAEQQQLSSLAREADKVQWSYVKDADLRARWTPAMQNLPQLGLALVLLVGGWLVIHGELQVGAMAAFPAYMLMMQIPFMMLGMIIMMGQRAAASAGRIYEVLDEKPTVVDRPGAVDLVTCEGDVSFDSVDFAYGENQPMILSGLDLHLRPGETVALVGRTGSGKSTVARLLPRFYDVTGGKILVDGQDVRNLTLASLRSHIGIVLDEPFLFSISIRDNIAYGRPDADLADVEAAAKAAGADEFIRDLPEGYDAVVGERGYTLSGGQRQRLSIARTLLVNPQILVFDDATSAIDVQVELQIHDSLRKLMEGRTTLIIAHRLSTIGLADRVVLLDEGHIVADGTHAELLATTPLYAEVLAQAEQAERAARDAMAREAERIVHHEPGRVGNGHVPTDNGASRTDPGDPFDEGGLLDDPLEDGEAY